MDMNTWFCSLPDERKAILRDDKWMLAQAAFDAGRSYAAEQSASRVRATVIVDGERPEKLIEAIAGRVDDVGKSTCA